MKNEKPRCESYFKNFKLCGDPATHRKLCPNGEYAYVCTYCFEGLMRAGEKGYEKYNLTHEQRNHSNLNPDPK